MKIEIGESLCYSYLRHVKRCWLVQSNWKVSEHWDKQRADEELEDLFNSMRDLFDPDGGVLKQTKDAGQFLRQGEIDVVGLGQDGSIHALDVAFHEAGLNYGGGADKRVLKKLLRAVMILKAYHPSETKLHVYFVSPKVHRAVQQPLEDIFTELEGEYPEIGWHLLTNDIFAVQVVWPTLEKAAAVADTSELFVRSAKLLELAGVGAGGTERRGRVVVETSEGRDAAFNPVAEESPKTATGQIQPLVQSLMKTLLENFPTLLDDADEQNMMDKERCKKVLRLRTGNHPLLRLQEEGSTVGGRERYYSTVSGDKYYLCSQWWKDHHLENAISLLRFVTGLIERRVGHPGLSALERHRAALQEYVG